MATNQIQTGAPALLSRKEAAQAINVCIRKLDSMTKARQVPCFKIGGKVLYRLDRVLTALDSLERQEAHRA